MKYKYKAYNHGNTATLEETLNEIAAWPKTEIFSVQYVGKTKITNYNECWVIILKIEVG